MPTVRHTIAAKRGRRSTDEKLPVRPEKGRSFREHYRQVVLPALRVQLGRENALSLPRIDHVIVASGVGKNAKEARFLEDVEKGLTLLTGQRPVRTLSRKSIAGFKLRAGQVSGMMVTLRGQRMEDFLQRFVHVALPRVRDFRGISLKSIDESGNLTVGIREAQTFPEVDPQTVETPFGLQITFVTTARSREEAHTLFECLGFPLTSAVHEQSGPIGPQRKASKRSV